MFIYSQHGSLIKQNELHPSLYAQVSVIERNAFDDLKNLEELNLSHNSLHSLPHDLFTPLHQLERVHLNHNPWVCNCNFANLFVWLMENTHKLPNGKSSI